MPPAESKRFAPATIWEEFGITQHLGGVRATRRLLEMCGIKKDHRVLDLGCGTGFSSCLISKGVGSDVVGADANDGVLRTAMERTRRQGQGERVALSRCDAHELPFVSATFDVAIAESLIVFCDAKRVFSEACRVLKRGGVLGINELTLLGRPPKDFAPWLWALFRIGPRLEEDWLSLFRQNGFVEVTSGVYPARLQEDFFSHLEVDGAVPYLASIVKSVSRRSVRSTFFTKEMLRAGLRLSPYIGYGLFAGRKA